MQFWSWFSSRWLWGGAGNKPVPSHPVVPRINFLTSAKGYNTKLIQSTLNVCLCQLRSILSRNVHSVFSFILSGSFPWQKNKPAKSYVLKKKKKSWFPKFEDVCPCFGWGKFSFSGNLSEDNFCILWWGFFRNQLLLSKASPLCSALTPSLGRWVYLITVRLRVGF